MVLPCLIGVFNSIGGSCFGWIGERISAEAGHLISYGENIENLRTHVQDLSDAIRSVEDRIKEAENNRGATLVDAVVDRLLERMTSLKTEAATIITNEERESDCTCIIRLRPNLLACYRTSKSARKAIDEAARLLEKEKKLDRAVANVDHLNCLGVTPNPNFEEFESRVVASNQIVEALKDPNVHKVGVYGMGGTGKTTLAVKIGADLQLDGTFSYVVLATVSEKQSLLQSNYQSDLISIQKQIAGALKIKLQDETLNARAIQLCEQLKKRDKLLIILDDIWSKFELETVGIPIDSKFTSKFKILMTSRNKMVLENEMDSTNNFGLDSLPHHEAQNLFDKMVCGDAQYSKWPPQVVDLCGGMPILLVTIGRALRNATRSIWEDALTQLKRFDGEDIDGEGYKKMEVSYNFLKNGEMKKLFLLCAQLNHRSIPMDDLLKYAMGLNLFKGRKKLKEVSSRLQKYLRDLEGCCLLQAGNEEGIIKMHDVIHKFASYVASRDHNVLSVANDGELEEWPSKDEFEDFSTICLPYCHLPPDHLLPAAFDTPNLESFIMLRSDIDASFKIPENFFTGMKGLKLMHLKRMSLSTVLVSSLSALVKLRTLCLDHCELSDITVIGELSMLLALSLIGSSIVLVPKEIGKLGSTLKLLDLRHCEKLKIIAAGVFSRLILLEDLRIGASFMRWEQLEGGDNNNNSVYETYEYVMDDAEIASERRWDRSEGWGKRRHCVNETYEAEVASLEEFKNLKYLNNLEICILDHSYMFPKDLVFKKLETFQIFFGNCGQLSTDYISTRTLEFEDSAAIELDGEGSKALMTRAESLLLSNVIGSVSVSEMDPTGFPELKHLEVVNGYGIQYIIHKRYSNCFFPKLETLLLNYLYNLESIWDYYDHPLQVGSFENLGVIEVNDCKLLNDLLSSNLARCLLSLKEIRVGRCDGMESIIVSKESENEEIKIGFTHQLRVLFLGWLHRLVSFYNFKQLERVPPPSTLFNKKIVFPKLEELILFGIKVEKIWDDESAISAGRSCWFQNLTTLDVLRLYNLRYLFTSSMVESLAQLKKLQVKECESIEEIVASTERETTGDIQLSFPKLDNITLECLPNLQRFCHANLLECHLLRKLVIKDCSKLKTFVSANDSSSSYNSTLFTEKVAFPNIEDVKINGMGNFKVIYGNQLHPNSFSKLKLLQIAEFPSIEEMEIYDGESLEKVFDIQVLPTNERETCEILPFQNLQWVVVSACPNLTSIFPTSLIPTLQQLKSLEVQWCDNVDFFGFNNTQQQNDALAKVISNLIGCKLRNKRLFFDTGYRGVVLQIAECSFQVPPVLFSLLITFPKLDEVVVSNSSIIQLFPCKPDHLATAAGGDDTDTHAKTLACIGLLKLTNLSSMTHIWSEHSPLKYHVIPEVLQVSHCDSLLSLAPPSTTLFKNLTSLVVWDCCKLIKLIASSCTAKSLVNLKEMTVRKCESLEEIVVIDDQWEGLASNEEYIVFDKLEVIRLKDLSSLTCFCSTSDCNFEFPSLTRIIVKNCPKMEFFSKGALSTPILQEEDEEARVAQLEAFSYFFEDHHSDQED